MRKSHGRLAIFVLLHVVFSVLSAHAQPNNATSKRVVYYYQTQFSQPGDKGRFYSLLPLIDEENLNKQGKPFTTDVLIGAFHLGHGKDHKKMYLNDLLPNDTKFDKLWKETPILQRKGINVNLFLGGYLDKSFRNLVSNFSFYYPILKQTLQTYKFDGIDLDVEDEAETTEQIKKLIMKLSSDFGQRFIITLAPVATDMVGLPGLSQINYRQLYTDVGSNISWFNVQFYGGFGSLDDPWEYTLLPINFSWPANVIVSGMLANDQDGDGFIDIPTVEQTVKSLVNMFPNFGGVSAWEYFNALPGGTARPAEWGTVFGKAMGLV